MKRILFAVLFTAAAVAATAQQPATPRNTSRAIRLAEQRLNLTAAQRESIETILKQPQPALEAMHRQLAAELAAYAASAQSGFDEDEAEARAMAEKYAEANMNAAVQRQKLATELLAVPTAEQRKQVQQLRSRFAAAMEERLQALGDSL